MEGTGDHEPPMPPYNINTVNYYDAMSEHDLSTTDMESVDLIQVRKKKSAKRSNSITIEKPEIPSKKHATQKREQMPLIKAFNIDVKILTLHLINKIGKSNFALKNMNQNMCHINTFTVDHYNETRKLLENLNYKFYSYTLKDKKPIHMILKGIHHSYTDSEVFEELNLYKNICEVLKVLKFETSKSKKENRDLMMFLVQFAPKTTIQQILSIKHLLHQTVSWQIFQKTDIVQCRRCQRYGHSATNCNMQYRCVKCLTQHLPGECGIDEYEIDKQIDGTSIFKRDGDGKQIKILDENGKPKRKTDENGEQLKATCVSCGQEGHPASWKGCPVYKKIIEARNERKRKREENAEQTRAQRQQSYNNFYNPNTSFAKMLQPNYTNVNFGSPKEFPKIQQLAYSKNNVCEPREVAQAGGNALDFIEKECSTLFGSGLFLIIKKIKEFLPEYKQISDRTEKQTYLIRFIMSIVDIP